ncbi:hypothetical protein NOR_08611 [Metarhizium rileyi]|uniref:Uncharacterized protein n=1 Tax=Metarhizium rileyi (strain RCEF 4871) TaxID=1649241 RepID=A0A166VZZ3_METRR|nr:hypothetical protein NOR_08611 [Metarhizium rileyi RCEF 4871]
MSVLSTVTMGMDSNTRSFIGSDCFQPSNGTNRLLNRAIISPSRVKFKPQKALQESLEHAGKLPRHKCCQINVDKAKAQVETTWG